MRGRDAFTLFAPLLRACSLSLRLFPSGVVRRMWVLVDSCPGWLGVGFRYVIARRLAMSLGDCVLFGRSVEVIGWERLSIGKNVSVQKGCYLDASGGLSIGSDVSIAHNTSILTFEHTWGDLGVPIRDNPCSFRPVCVNDDVWIGCGVRILSGVVIGSRSVVAAGAVVVRDVGARTLVGGVPAKLIKEI